MDKSTRRAPYRLCFIRDRPWYRRFARTCVVSASAGSLVRSPAATRADLTPYYLFDEDAEEFHDKYRAVCDSHDKNAEASARAACKDWCDEYFYIPARREHGVGGVFFDDLEDDAGSASDGARVRGVRTESFTRAIADEWLDSYLPIVDKRRDSYGEGAERWHHQRRGRYIEFNLLYDRGVRFGFRRGRIRPSW